MQGQFADQPVDVIIQHQSETESEMSMPMGAVMQSVMPAATGALGMSPLGPGLVGLLGVAGMLGMRRKKQDPPG